MPSRSNLHFKFLTGLSARVPECQKLLRGSATAEEPCDALRQLKYYGRFLTELLTRNSANAEEPCEHSVSWNRVKCHTSVRRIAFENVCNQWITFKVIQGHCRCYHLIGHKGPNVTNPICLTCKNCSHKCAADCEHCVTQSSTELFW